MLPVCFMNHEAKDRTPMEPNSVKFDPLLGNWKTEGTKLLIVLSLMVISAGTLAALKAIFHPPDTIDFDFSWTCGFQFMMLYLMGDSILRLKTHRLVLYVLVIAIWTTTVFFAFDMWL